MDQTSSILPTAVSLFALIAETRPDTLAVVDGDRQITYGELHRRVILLAQELRRRNIGNEDPVGLLLDRSPELYLGMLAVHKCGGCYVVLDPVWPDKRLAYIAGDTDCRVILSVSGQAVPEELRPRILLLDRFDWERQPEPEIIFVPPEPSQLAYILYTSGSTGVPKGVEIEHGGLANFIAWQNGRFPHARQHRTSQYARPGFDASGSEIWPALCSGSTLYVVPPAISVNIRALAEWLVQNQMDECFLPTPLAELLLDVNLPATAHLKILRTGGDRLTRKPPADFPAMVVNEYGPTECSIVSTYAIFYPGDDPQIMPDIGVALDHLEVRILDDDLQELPDGEIGEICVSGIGLARGYHHRPDLTAAAFVASPAAPAKRIYRTGDLGKRNFDGKFEFIGRKDFQTKLRGQRLELGEIEEVIAARPEVAKCVVTVRESAAGAKTLAAYVTLERPLDDPANVLLDIARGHLPDYMVPSTLTVLDAMPLTANGKIDRQALPDPAAMTAETIAPLTECGQILAEMWQNRLKGTLPQSTDNFFYLGGDSLQAAELSLEIGSRFRFDAPSSLLMEHPDLAALARAVEQQSGSGDGLKWSKIYDPAANVCFEATSYQLSHWLLEQFYGAPNLNNIVLAVHLEGEIDPARLRKALNCVAADHQSLRSGLIWDGQTLHQQVAREVNVELPYQDWSGRTPEEQRKSAQQIVEQHRQRVFEPTRPPLLAAELIRLDDRHCRIYLTISHLIFDGWSAALLFAALRHHYLRPADDRELAENAAAAFDYADFAEFHHRQRQLGAFDRGLTVWQQMLRDPAPLPPLNFEKTSRSGDRQNAGCHRFTIPSERCAALKRFAAAAQTTLFTVLQAILHVELHKFTGATDITTGTAFANRQLKQTEKIIGMFINSLPLRHQLKAQQSFRQLVGSFKNTVTLCFQNSDVPLELILEKTGRSGHADPLFRVSLLLQNLPWAEDDRELRLYHDELGGGIAQLDLKLVMEERHGGLECHAEYKEANFDAGDIADFCDIFSQLADALLAQPDEPLTQINCPQPAGARPGIYIIGETGLVPGCAEILQRAGFQLLGFFSDTLAATRWAHERHIPCYPGQPDKLHDILSQIPFDYLFSIVNDHILPPDIFSLPQKMAINYHDSPLPRYAGLNACSWAVINGEKTHGVTWHRIDGGIDTGDICLQQTFDVAPDATALQLSLKASETALAALTKLAPMLRGGQIQTLTQDRSQRSCYRAADRPYAGALLDWRKPAAELVRLIRGLDTGSYDNQLAVPKLAHRCRLLAVGSATAEPSDAATPGQILDIGDDSLLVAAGDGAVRLRQLYGLNGDAIDFSNFECSEILTDAGQIDLERCNRAWRAAAANERFWLAAMRDLHPPPLPIYRWQELNDRGDMFLGQGAGGKQIAAMFGLFFARLCGETTVFLPLKVTGGGDELLPAGFLLEYLPWRIEVDFDANLSQNLAAAETMLEQICRRRECPGDLRLRYRSLPGLATLSPALELTADGSVKLCHCGRERQKLLGKLFAVFCDAAKLHPDRPLKAITLQEQSPNFAAGPDRLLPDCSYIKLFVEGLANHAGNTAVIADNRQMSYRELDEYSTQIAHLLRRYGATPGEAVAVCAERSPELAGALLGIFKAGAAYLALEPGLLPDARRNELLDQAEVKLLIQFGSGPGAAGLPEHIQVLDLNDPATLAGLPKERPELPDDSSETAYLMFTSGTTGTPKGVMISQRNLVNHNLAVIDAFGLTPADRVLQFGVLSFDLSVEEIFPILLTGGTLIFRPGPLPPSPPQLLDYARNQNITVFDLPTAYWHLLVNVFESSPPPPSLRLIIIGGEHASGKQMERCRELAPDVRLLNTYGPTEATIIATAGQDFHTIGRPIANVTCYILDRFMRLCPPECQGEIYLGGDGVAKGYLNDAVRTSRCFLNDPWRPGGRIYRTGDLGCYTADGEIVCLGRADRQVKIHGFRVELESVETALRNIPGVENALAVGSRNADGGIDRLDAYVISRAEISYPQAKALLARDLPEYMIPASITPLAALPVTATGKIDYQKLPPPRHVSEVAAEVEPDTALEMQISLIYKKLLKLGSIDFERSFFALGGDSLAALNLCLEIERVCQLKLSMEEFYRHPTVRGLAQSLQQRGSQNDSGSLLLLADKGPEQPLYLIHATSGDILGYVNLVELLDNRKIYAFQARGLEAGQPPDTTIVDMARYYVQLLKKHQPRGPYYLGGWCFGGIVAYEMACQLVRNNDQVGFLGLIETWGKPPVTPAFLLRFLGDFWRSGCRPAWRYLKQKIKNRSAGPTGTVQLDFLAARFGNSRAAAEIEQLKKLYAINLQAAHRYQMQYYPGKVNVFCSDLSKYHGLLCEPERRWTNLAETVNRIEIADCDHRAILKHPSVDKVAARINEALHAADQQ